MVIGSGVLAAVYFAAAKLGLAFDAVSGVATAVWPPTGISLAALVLFGRGLWPGIALGAFLVNAQTGIPIAAAAGIAVGNTLEALAGAWLLGRVGFSPGFDRLRDTLAHVLLAAVGSTLVSATIGATSVWVTGGSAGAAYLEVWRVWWIGDLTGDLVVAPLLLVWAARPRLAPREWLELGVICVVLVGVGLLVFVSPARHSYLLFPPLLWATLRFGPRGAAAATFLFSVISIACTARGLGPFALESRRESLFELQMFAAIVAMTALVVGSIVSERRQAVALRDEFLSIASHELNTPLTALKLRVEGLVRGLGAEPSSERVRSNAVAVERQVARIEQLVQNLLDVSRIDAQRLRIERAPVDLAELVKGLVIRLPRAGSIEVDCEAGCVGEWDAVRLEQVITNLIINALTHGAPPVRLTARREGDRVRIAVSDAGPGIQPADRARIFERFEQVSSRRSVGGLGLGLYITARIVEAHGGTIRLDAAVEDGTTFVIELPLAAA
jgi:signal transduction histidine kinase